MLKDNDRYKNDEEELKRILFSIKRHISEENTEYVRLIDIPNPLRSQFVNDSYGSTMPVIKNEGMCFYWHDFEKWRNVRLSAKYIERKNYEIIDDATASESIAESIFG